MIPGALNQILIHGFNVRIVGLFEEIVQVLDIKVLNGGPNLECIYYGYLSLFNQIGIEFQHCIINENTD